jgi:hypothetical protein
MKDIPEVKIKQAATEVLGLAEYDSDIFADSVKLITIPQDNVIIFHLNDGTEVEKEWHSTAKKDC